MKKRSSSKASPAEGRRTRAGIVLTAEHPEADVRHIVRAIVRRGLVPVPPKASISLRVDADVLAWFKSAGPGYQTRMNAVLRAFKEAAGAPVRQPATRVINPPRKAPARANASDR